MVIFKCYSLLNFTQSLLMNSYYISLCTNYYSSVQIYSRVSLHSVVVINSVVFKLQLKS